MEQNVQFLMLVFTLFNFLSSSAGKSEDKKQSADKGSERARSVSESEKGAKLKGSESKTPDGSPSKEKLHCSKEKLRSSKDRLHLIKLDAVDGRTGSPSSVTQPLSIPGKSRQRTKSGNGSVHSLTGTPGSMGSRSGSRNSSFHSLVGSGSPSRTLSGSGSTPRSVPRETVWEQAFRNSCR